MSNFSPVTHTIFDLDGLILDTERFNLEIYEQIAISYGKQFPVRIQQMILGRAGADAAETFIKETGIPMTIDECRELRRTKAREMFSRVKLLPGVERLITHLKTNSIPIALATSSDYDSIQFKLSKHKKILDSFTIIVSGKDPEVKNGKPAPDIFLITAMRFPDKPDPGKCLVFEDSQSGVKSAAAAGMQVVMVPDPLVHPEVTKEATLVLKSLEEFRPEQFFLPAFAMV